MTITERIKNIFILPRIRGGAFEHNPLFDTMFLLDTCEFSPELVRARDGRSYIYFESMSCDEINLVRKMGLNPRLHKSHKYTPPKYVYRIRISGNMPKSARDIINKLRETYDSDTKVFTISWDINEMKSRQDYNDYVSQYKLKVKQNTK